MSQSDEFENLKSRYIASLTSHSQIKGTKKALSHLEDFLTNNLNFKALSDLNNRDRFKVYLQNKVSKSSFRIYWSYFDSFYSWLETNYLKVESIRPQEPQPQTPAPALTEKSSQDVFDFKKWSQQRDSVCPDCTARPIKGKDGFWYVACPRPKWKEGKYGRIPSGTRGKIHIEECQNLQAFLIKRKEWSIQKPQQASVQIEKGEETEEETYAPVFKKPKRPMEEIVNELGVCLNPILMRQVSKTDYGGLLCHVCRNQKYEKWLACEEIIKDLQNPVTYSAFIRSMTEKESDWWQTPNSDQMTLEEIEKLYGLRESSKPKRISCTNFCSSLKIMNCEKYPSCDLNANVSKPEKELDVFDIAEREAEPLRFREGKTIPEETSVPLRTEALKLKRYPSEEVTALREPLRERLKEIVPKEGR